MRLHFGTDLKNCQKCEFPLMPYATRRRRVLPHDYGDFRAVIQVKRCRNRRHGTFRPESLNRMVPPGCTYALDIVVDSAMSRLIEGRSCSEISHTMRNGISEGRHVGGLGNQTLGIFHEIHRESIEKFRDHMKSYILQIDATTDSEFSMIAAVRNSVSDFIFHGKRCHSESKETIVEILRYVKHRLGIPSDVSE